MEFGVYQARRAGLEAKDVANTRTLTQFRKLLKHDSKTEIGPISSLLTKNQPEDGQTQKSWHVCNA